LLRPQLEGELALDRAGGPGLPCVAANPLLAEARPRTFLGGAVVLAGLFLLLRGYRGPREEMSISDRAGGLEGRR